MSKRGAPRKSAHLKKEPISLKLPLWLIDKLDQQRLINGESRAVQIEKALLAFNKNWNIKNG